MAWPDYFEPIQKNPNSTGFPDYFEPVNFNPPPRTPDTSSGYGLPSLRDIGLTALKMPIQLGEAAAGLGDIATWGNLSKILDPSIPKGWKDYISSFESPELKAARQQFGEAKGFRDTASAIYQNPGLVPLAAEESLPYLAGGMGVARGALRYGPGIGRIGASMLGEAVTGAGTQASQIREEKGSFGPSDIPYAVGSGAITGLISGGSGKVAQRFGLPDIDAMLADKTIRGVRRIPALIGGGVGESVEEALQSGQEQAAVNLATGKPIGQGVAPGMTMGSVTGGFMGSTLPTLRRPGAKQTVLPPVPKDTRQISQFAGPNAYGGETRFIGRPDGSVVDKEGGLIELNPNQPGVPPLSNRDLISELMRKAAKGEDISAELAQLQERGVDLAQPVSPDQPSGQLKSLSVEIPAETFTEETQAAPEPEPEPEPFNLGEYPLQEATNEPETTLRLRIPVDKPRSGNITYQRINGRNVKFVDGVAEDQAGERELVQEPQIERTPENESLLRKFFNDESGTMDFDEMRRRFLAIRKGTAVERPLSEEQKITEIGPKSREYQEIANRDRVTMGGVRPEAGVPVEHNPMLGGFQEHVRGNKHYITHPMFGDKVQGPFNSGEEAGDFVMQVQDSPEFDRYVAQRKGEPIGDTEKKGVAKFYSKEYRDSLSTQDLQRFLTLDPESVGPDLHREIENELKRRGVVPKPDYSPISKNIYEGWNWEQGQGKTSEITDSVARPSMPPRKFQPGELVRQKSTGKIGRISTTAKELREMSTQELDVYRDRIVRRPNQDNLEGDKKAIQEIDDEFARRRNVVTPFERPGTLKPIEEQGIRTRIPNEVPDDDVSEMSSPGRPFKGPGPSRPDLGFRNEKPHGQTIAGTLDASISARNNQEARAREAGINPKGLGTEQLSDAIYSTKVIQRDSSTPEEVAEAKAKLARYEEINKEYEANIATFGLRQEANRVRAAAVQQQAAKRGIDPKKFKTLDELEDAVFKTKLQEPHIVQQTTEALSKLNYHEKTGNEQGIGEAVEQLNDINRRAREELVRETLDELVQANPQIAEMRVPGTNNVALGPRMDDTAILDALGTALYSRDRAATWLKEGFQNSDDEKKISKNTNPIRVVFRENVINPVTRIKEKSLIIQDGGRGLTTEALYTYFSNVGSSGKKQEVDASGGFGFAKASPFLGGTLMRVTSIVKEGGHTLKHTFQGDPKQFKNQQVGVPLTTVQVLNSTPTGFMVEVFYPPEQDFGVANSLLIKTAENTEHVDNLHMLVDAESPANSALTKDFLEGKSVSPNYPSSYLSLKGEPIAPKKDSITILGADIDFHYELDDKEREWGETVFLNNKTFSKAEYYGTGYPAISLPDLPKKITVNIKSTVEEGQPGYPFTLNREDMADHVKVAVKEWLKNKIIEPAKIKKANEIQNIYDNIPTYKTDQNRDFVVLDSGGKYIPAEMAAFTNSRTMKGIADVMGDLLSVFATRYNTGTLGDTEKWGLRIADKERKGINIQSQRNQANRRKNYAIMISPFGIASDFPQDPKAAARGIVHAILHEFSHNSVRDEAGVTARIYELSALWPLEEQIEYANKIHRLLIGPNGGYSPEFQSLLLTYVASRGRAGTGPDVLARQRESPLTTESGRISEMADSTGPDGKRIRGESKPRKFGGYPRQPRTTKEAGKSASQSKNQQAPITPETQSIRYPATSIRRLKEALQSGKLLQPYKLRMQSLERSRRAGAISGVKDPGMKGYFQKLGMLRGPLTPEIPIETRLTQADLDNLMGGITNSTLMPYSKLRAQTGVMKLFAGQIPTGSESRLLGKVFGEDLPQLIQLHAGLGFTHPDDIKKFLFGAINIPKSLMSALDLSYTLRQAAPFMLTKEYWNSFGEMWKAFPGKQGNEAFEGSMQSIYDDPIYDFFQEFDRPLFIGEFKPGSDLAHREEAFGSDIASRIPLMAGMGRMQTAFINKLRFDVAKRMLNDMYKSGYIDWAEGQEGPTRDKSRADVQKMLDFVNNFTGRGNLGAAARFGPLLNSAFFSPAFQMSRFHILASPVTYLNAPPVVRKEAWKSMFAISSMLGLGIALTKAMGGDVEDDPNSTDWGKGRFGNTRVDFSQGLQPILVAGSRISSGKSVSPDKIDANGRLIPGKSYDLGKTFTGPTIRSIIGNFLINKASPTGGLINVWSQGEQAFPPSGIGGIAFPGKQQGNMPKAAALNMVIPMVVNDMVDLYKEDPNISPRGMSFLIASVLGLPVQTFDEPKQSNSLPPLPSMQLNAPQPSTPQQDFYNNMNRR